MGNLDLLRDWMDMVEKRLGTLEEKIKRIEFDRILDAVDEQEKAPETETALQQPHPVCTCGHPWSLHSPSPGLNHCTDCNCSEYTPREHPDA